MADTLTAFETIKYNLGNRKALDGLTASEIKKAAGRCLFTFSKTKQNSMHGCLQELLSVLCWRKLLSGLCTLLSIRKGKWSKGERSCPLFSGNPPPHM